MYDARSVNDEQSQWSQPHSRWSHVHENHDNVTEIAGGDETQRGALGGSRSPRITYWFTFFLISIITLGSSMEASEVETNTYEPSGHKQRWAIVCSTLTFLLTVSVVMMHSSARYSPLIIGTKLEGFFIVILLAFWTAIVAVVSDAENGLAVNEEGVVVFGNLYYFSWGGLVCSVLLFVSYLRSIYFIDVVGEFRSRAPRLMLWSAFMTTAFIVMGSSTSIYDINCDVTNPEKKFCGRTKLAVALGIIGSLCSILIVGMKIATQYAPFWLEFSSSVLLFVLYAFGVAYVTSEQGPGAPLGNLYYSIWASFIEAFFICVGCFEAYQETLTADEQRSQYEQRIRREMENEEEEQLSKAHTEDEHLFTDYDGDDYEYEDGRSVRSSYVDNDGRSVRSSYVDNDGRSVRSSYVDNDGRSVRSSYVDNDGRSVRSSYVDDGRSTRSGFGYDGRSTRSGFTEDGRSARSGFDARSSRSGFKVSDATSVRSFQSQHRTLDLDDDDVESVHSQSSRVPLDGGAQSLASRSVPLDDDDDDAPWLQHTGGDDHLAHIGAARGDQTSVYSGHSGYR